ncbi:MAG: leucine-rich repeat protein [Verrucomicrobia bacterium]|nr:leucine-rich repeat protein [Verrucomicrobiota bacterium]
MKTEKLSSSCAVSRFIASFILLASLLVLPKAHAAVGDTFTVDQLKYTVLTEEHATQTGTVSVKATYNSILGNIEIPASVANGGINYSVTLIPDDAFSDCSDLTGITIPGSVAAIGAGAFYNCYSMTSLVIGNGVANIGDEAFSNCGWLTSIIIPNSVTGIGAMTFYDCESLTSVVIGDSVAVIGDEAFSTCYSLPSITIPDSVTVIGYGVFHGCSSLTEIAVGKNNPNFSSFEGVLFNKDYTTLIQFPSAKAETYTVPGSVTRIGDGAFALCTSLTSITIPNSVISIGAEAFVSCIDLTRLELGDGVASIGERAFYNCNSLNEIVVGENNSNFSSLEGVLFNKDKTLLILSPRYKTGIYTIPNGVISIGAGAFSDCAWLTSIIIPDSVTNIGDEAFSSCDMLTNITLPNGVTDIGDWTFSGCSDLTSITIPNSVAGIGEGVFYYCWSLTSVVIGDSVTSIGGDAFNNCNKLTSITIPDSVTHIGYDAFSGCEQLPPILFSIGGKMLVRYSKGNTATEYSIPGTVTRIGTQAFEGCSVLTSITIPNSVTHIGDWAFGSCSKLASIEIPNSVVSIGDYAFTSCSGLTSITIPDSVTSIGDAAFFFCSSLTSITIPDSVTSIGDGVFSYCRRLTSITIPEGVTRIGNNTFFYCSGLTSITIPDGVTQIGSYAFASCSKLTSIEIPDSVTSIGGSAFMFCSGLTGVYFRGNAPELPEGNAFGAPSVIYYMPGTTGWTNPWSGRPTVLWVSAPEITEQPKSQAVKEGDSATFNVVAVGAEPLSYQWYKEGVAIEGATGASYTIEHVSAEDLGSYTVVVSNELGEAPSNAAKLTLAQPRRATATLVIEDGVVVGVNIIDGGWGYTEAPHIVITDETGSGATGHCIIEESVVTQIIIDSAGSNYSGEAVILIGSPLSYTGLEISVSIPNVEVKITMHLILGKEYRLWSSVDCINWTPVRESFIAEEEEKDMLFPVEGNGRFFKLQEI